MYSVTYNGNIKISSIVGINWNGAFDKTSLSFQGDVGFRGLPGLPGPPGEGLQGQMVRFEIISPMNLSDYSNESVILNWTRALNSMHRESVCVAVGIEEDKLSVFSSLINSAVLLFQGNMGRSGPPGPQGPPGEGIQGHKVGYVCVCVCVCVCVGPLFCPPHFWNDGYAPDSKYCP